MVNAIGSAEALKVRKRYIEWNRQPSGDKMRPCGYRGYFSDCGASGVWIGTIVPGDTRKIAEGSRPSQESIVAC